MLNGESAHFIFTVVVGKISHPTLNARASLSLSLDPLFEPNNKHPARSQNRGLKLKLRMVETVLFRDGRLSSWWFTDKVRFRYIHLPLPSCLRFSPLSSPPPPRVPLPLLSHLAREHRTASFAKKPRRAPTSRPCASDSCTWGSRCTSRRTRGNTRASSGGEEALLRDYSDEAVSTPSSRTSPWRPARRSTPRVPSTELGRTSDEEQRWRRRRRREEVRGEEKARSVLCVCKRTCHLTWTCDTSRHTCATTARCPAPPSRDASEGDTRTPPPLHLLLR